MAGVEHVISMEQTLSRKVERTEAGETSGGHDQPVIATEASEKLSIAVHEKVCTSPLGQRFKKLRDAGANQAETKPKIQKVVFLLREQKNFRKYYKPRAVSLGPIHHGKSKYRLAENYKLRLAQAFVSDSGKSDEYIYGQIEKNIEQLKEYFDEEDLFLLENQLPYQLLKDLMKISARKQELKNGIRDFITIHSKVPEKDGNDKKRTPIHLLDLLRTRLLGSNVNKTSKKDWQSFRNVVELKAAGIKLEPSNSNHLTNISFTRRWNFYPGFLSLPPITVDDSTGPKFLNLIAFEMCPDFENNYGVTSYISFLDSLIDEANDVIELRKARILSNLLGSDQEVAQLFNEIGRDLVPNPKIYSHVRTQIQEYYDKKLMTWLSQFIHNHFSSPWTFLAFLGALLALALSAVQTWYTVDSPPGPCDDFCKHYPH
uniref:Uncharacterized protein n=1 Tax=Fagus sylvatica TaxID=28930 RepID=A0A2N9GGH1_FAGSY